MRPGTAAGSHPLAERNIVFLEQTRRLLQALDDAEYVRCFPPAVPSGVGAHVRHIADHYVSFLDGLPAGRVDYDQRRRDPLVERSRSAGAGMIADIIGRLGSLAAGTDGEVLEVVMDCGGDSAEQIIAASSIERELQFLVSHTVHHCALIAVLLRRMGREPADGFGLAPSTARFLEKERVK